MHLVLYHHHRYDCKKNNTNDASYSSQKCTTVSITVCLKDKKEFYAMTVEKSNLSFCEVFCLGTEIKHNKISNRKKSF